MKFDKIQDYLAESFKNYGEKISIRYRDKAYTYHVLNAESDQAAAYLQEMGVGSEDFVGVFIENRYDLICVFIAILKLGAVFVPLDQEYPINHLVDMVTISGLQYIVADDNKSSQDLLEHCNNVSVAVYSKMKTEKRKFKGVKLNQDDAAYLYFTSGTTGKPKPILGVNKSLAHFIDWEIMQLELNEHVKVSQLTPPCHDPFLRDVLAALCAGGTLCIPPERNQILASSKLITWIEENEITLIHCTPSLFSLLDTSLISENMFKNLKYILLAGEKVVPNMLNSWYARFDERIRLYNLYGPTETTLAKFFHPITKKDMGRNSIPIGRPMSGAQAILLDENGKVCPQGSIGEIYIRTPYRTRGYYNDEELNQKKFIQNPFNKNKSDVIYKTGDLARILPEGSFEFMGRVDRQVKIRGNRVELSAIENNLLILEHINEAAVLYESGEKGNLLMAFIVTDGNQPVEEVIRAKLCLELPDYMIPDIYFYLEAIPVTSNNKRDYQALLDYYSEADREVILPQTSTEQKVSEIYQKILRQDRLSTDQSFFALGGSSLNAMALIDEIAVQFGVEVPLVVIFESGSVQGISSFIDENSSDEIRPIAVIEEADDYAASQAQRRMYIVNMMIGDNVNYNLPMVISAEGTFQIETLHHAINEMVDRHEILRTTFFVRDNEVFQKINNQLTINIPYDMIAENDLQEEINAFIQPFDLHSGPLLRVKVLRVSKSQHYIMIDLHHIIADGKSLIVFAKELITLCSGQKLMPLTIQYKDYVVWQRQRFASDAGKRMEEYWLNLFREIPILDFPYDYPRPMVKTYTGDRVSIDMNNALSDRVRKKAKELSITAFDIYYSAFLILLHRYTGQEEFVIGTPVQGRHHYELQDMIGMFVNTLPLKSRIMPEDNLLSLIKRTSKNNQEAFINEEYPLDELVDHLDLVRDTSRNPLFDVVFAYHNFEMPNMKMNDLLFRTCDIEKVQAKFDLEMALMERKDSTFIQVEYCSDLLNKDTVIQMITYYQDILGQMLETDKSVSDVRLLTKNQEKIIFSHKNFNEIRYPEDVCVHEIFDRVAAAYPDRVALKYLEQEMTYAELHARSDQIAAVLIKEGIGADDCVPILAFRSFEMIIGVLGIIKAGGAYVPINPEYPEERIRYMLEKIQAKIILKSESSIIVPTETRVIDLQLCEGQTADPEIDIEAPDMSKSRACPSNLIYVIFTSGTTGNPKGVMIEHRNVVRLFFHEDSLYDFNENDVWMMFHEFCFDFSVWEIFGALLFGGKLVIVPQDIIRDAFAIHDLVRHEKVTVLNQVPSAFYNYIESDDHTPDYLRYLIFGGEKLIPSRIHKWQDEHSEISIINMYGITETTVHVTYKKLSDKDLESDCSNIGRAIPTLKVYILLGNELCGIGIPGEICVSGLGLARGYMNNNDLTLERFVDNPVNPGERIYRSGDLGKWLPNGEIVYLGRIDHQVQLHGFRIELGEIENKLRQYQGIHDVVADVRDQEPNNFLVAYYIADRHMEGQELRDYLMKKLPQYMVPQYFVSVNEIPLTINGKVNKKALPDPKQFIQASQGNELPKTEVEQLLLEAWSTVLGITVTGTQENFFALGGDSIKALQVVSELKKHNYTTKVDMIFRYQTIQALAPYVTISVQQAEQGLVSGEVEILPVQSWFLHRVSEGKHHWNQAVMLETTEKVDEDELEGAMQRVVFHHDALRCIFIKKEDYYQVYNRGIEGELFEWQVYKTDAVLMDSLVKDVAHQLHESFLLDQGPLVKAAVFQSEDITKLFIVVHHLVIDSISWRVFLEDLLKSYHAAVKGEEYILPLKTDALMHWSKRLPEYLQNDDAEDEIRYWSELTGQSYDRLKNREMPEEKDTFANNCCKTIIMSQFNTKRLLTQANIAYNTEPQELLLTGLGVALNNWNGEGEKFLVNLEGHGREAILRGMDISRTIGWFTSLYPVLLDISPRDLSMQIKTTKEMLRGIPNKGVGYGIYNYLEVSPFYRKWDVRPQISFSYFGEMSHIKLDNAFRMTDMSYGSLYGDQTKRPYDLDIVAIIEQECLTFQVNYNKEQYTEQQIEEFLQIMIKSVAGIIEHCMIIEETEFTPDDFGNDTLTFDELDAVLKTGDMLTV